MLSIIYSIRHTLFTYRFYYKYSLKNFPISYINKTPIFHSRKSVARGIGGSICQAITGTTSGGETARPGKGGAASEGDFARAAKALRDLDEGAEEAGRGDGHEAEIPCAEAAVGVARGKARRIGEVGAENVAGGGAAGDGEPADGVGVHHAAAEAAGDEAHRVAQVELDEGVDGCGALGRAVGEHVDAEETAVGTADDVAERVGDGRAEAVEEGAVEGGGQSAAERVGVAEEGAGEGSAGVRLEDGEAGIGDVATAIAVEF